jgi:predicted DNA-binding protein
MNETPIFPIRLPKPIKEKLRARAKEDNTTMAHVVIEALNKHLKK